tara:strand:+ start:159 stop:422 length:264 start_codon:yes stop_codon:yes gene_type:complete
MSIAGVARSDARDCERKGKGDVHGVSVSAEADTSTGETLETTQGRIVAGLPRIPYLKRGLALIYVTRALNPVPAVFFVATVPTVAAD